MKKDLVDIMLDNVGAGTIMTVGSIGLVLMMVLLFFGQEILGKLVNKLDSI